MNNMHDSPPFAEVIESSLYTWCGQTWQWDVTPPFGALVTITTPKRTVYGIVYQVKTGSRDPIRSITAYQKTEHVLRQEYPHIFEFLQTTFSCVTVGFDEHNVCYYQIAPEPPKIHAFITLATRSQAERFFSDARYLHVLFGLSAHLSNLDELLLALLHSMKQLTILTRDKIAVFIDTFSLLTGNEYRKTKLFLQRAQPLLETID